MALTRGARLGPYEIIAALGAGGMGEVYRARDPRLDRDVAIKILPAAFAADADRVARFQREARTLASLNHPHIGGIHGIEDADGVTALVMEMVEGEDLAERLARGAMPLDDALPIARQIAEGLEAAHEQGIIHRDLKPANIKVRPDGAVKVLDFGLAKALEPVTAAGGDVMASPTITSPAMTQMGMILGTPAYMSPEQAKGRQADKRSDVWAFGAVLYEMLSGQRAFKGDDIADTLAAVLRQDIDWTALPASTPASVRRLMARCLDRDVRRRLRDIGEARIVLDDPSATVLADAGGVAPAPPQPLWRRAIPVVLSAIVTGLLGGAAAWYLKPLPTPAVTRFPLTLPEGQAFSSTGSLRHLLALSPDGTQVVYEANSRLYLRSMSQLDATVIQGTEGYQTVTEPAFSPDGRFVAFYALADQTLKKIAVTGGAAVTICQADNPFGISWELDGTIVFGQGGKGIMRVSENGGTPDVLVAVKDGESAYGPQILPGGQHVMFSLATGTARDRWDKADIVVQSLTSKTRNTIIKGGGSDARYLPTSHIVYARGGSVFAVAFDVEQMRLTGDPVQMVEGVRRSAGGTTGAAHFSVSSTGSLIYIPGPVSAGWALLEIALIDRKGGVERLMLPTGPYVMPRVSPDGSRIAFGTDDGKEAIIYVYDLSRASAMQRLTGLNSRFPTWTSDNRTVAFQSDREGDLAIWRSAVGGTAERLTKPEPGTSHVPESWSPKGDTFLFSVTKGSDVSLWTYSLPDRKAAPFGEVHSSNPTGAMFSPDGRWVAYSSTERSRTTIYVQPFPATRAIYQLVAKGSDNPHAAVWSADGKELFYNPRPQGFEAVTVTPTPTSLEFGNPVKVPRPFQTGPSSLLRDYDIAPNGRFVGRFVGLIPAGQAESNMPLAGQIQVVLNWFEELNARVPAGK